MYAPHMGLGLFVEERDAHDLLELRSGALDQPLFEHALDEARALNLDYRGRLDSVQILDIDEQLTHISRLDELPLG